MQNLKYWQAQSNDGFRMWKSKHEEFEGKESQVSRTAGRTDFWLPFTSRAWQRLQAAGKLARSPEMQRHEPLGECQISPSSSSSSATCLRMVIFVGDAQALRADTGKNGRDEFSPGSVSGANTARFFTRKMLHKLSGKRGRWRKLPGVVKSPCLRMV